MDLEIIKKLPEDPGIYKYFDKNNKLLYIGKAKNIKKRVASYFINSSDFSTRIKIMVRQIEHLEYMVVETEYDALLLENNLIKKYQPKYNIMLKDDKTYPYIVIKNESFPRIFFTRNLIKDGSLYFGPYASQYVAKIIMSFLIDNFKIRTCKLNLSKENINKNKFKECLRWHINLCNAPCTNKQTSESYNNNLKFIKEILKGNIKTVIEHFGKLMEQASNSLDFENAQVYKEKISYLKKFQAKSTVVNPKIDNIDVYSIYSTEKYAYVNYLRVIKGSIIQTKTLEIRKKLDESNLELLSMAIIELRQIFNTNSKYAVVPFTPHIKQNEFSFIIPRIGDKKKLLDLSYKNALYFYRDRAMQRNKKSPKNELKKLLLNVQKDLKTDNIPFVIECFDNSNMQGSYPVASMVQFKDAKPNKKEYRHFNIKTVQQIDDFASMSEVVYRRYKRLLEEGKALPQLVVVDGGKGQLSAAYKSLKKLQIEQKVDLIGIAKKLEDIFKINDSLPLLINKKSSALRLIKQLRDEAHRFAITFHRQKRSNDFIKSQLQDIEGIGEKTCKKLLKHFRTVDNIKNASLEEVASLIGNHRSKILKDALDK